MSFFEYKTAATLFGAAFTIAMGAANAASVPQRLKILAYVVAGALCVLGILSVCGILWLFLKTKGIQSGPLALGFLGAAALIAAVVWGFLSWSPPEKPAANSLKPGALAAPAAEPKPQPVARRRPSRVAPLKLINLPKITIENAGMSVEGGLCPDRAASSIVVSATANSLEPTDLLVDRVVAKMSLSPISPTELEARDNVDRSPVTLNQRKPLQINRPLCPTTAAEQTALQEQKLIAYFRGYILFRDISEKWFRRNFYFIMDSYSGKIQLIDEASNQIASTRAPND